MISQEGRLSLEVYHGEDTILRGDLGRTLRADFGKDREFLDSVDYTKQGARLSILKADDTGETEVTCTTLQWEADECVVSTLEDCIHMEGAHWYGATQIRSQKWPLEKWDRKSEPYVTGDSMQDQYGGVQERYWVNSKGVAFYVDWEVPLWVSMNDQGDQLLCFKARYKDSPYLNHDESPLELNYTVCKGNDIKHVHQYMVDTYLGHPIDIPDERMFTDPIWSTWAQFKEAVNQSLVMQYATDILNNNFTNSQLEIDDDWEMGYGLMEFNLEKFPDPVQMVSDLDSMGFRTTLWVHPFYNLESKDFLNRRFAMMRAPKSFLPALISWWQGTGGIIDFTRETSAQWWTDRLKLLQEKYGINSFKFDAGETNWLPGAFDSGTKMRNPSDYTTYFAEMAHSMDADVRHQEVRVGARTQHLPIFVRMMDKDSRWNDNNGLATIIPHALTYSIIGYPFILPDMIGGNAYLGMMPNRELFMRWVELNAFLPGFQFSIAPWQYDAEVLEVSQRMLRLHQDYSGTFIELARNCVETGEPIIRPLWWIAPDDERALMEDSEFLVGDDILVAPVITQGATTRNIYLPQGLWKDMNSKNTYIGPIEIESYAAPLHILPYFQRVQ